MSRLMRVGVRGELFDGVSAGGWSRGEWETS